MLQRESVPGGYEHRLERMGDALGTNEVINEESDNTVAEAAGRSNESFFGITNNYMPVVLVANDKLKNAIEQICLQLAKTYK